MRERTLKFATVLFLTSLFFSVNVQAAIDVFVNNNWIPAEAIIVDGRTLVPVRGVFEKLGYSVSYDNDTKTASLIGDKEIYIRSGFNYFFCDSQRITPDVPPQILNSRFYLPLRAVSEAIGADVQWDENTRSVYITSVDSENKYSSDYGEGSLNQPTSVYENDSSNYSYSNDDYDDNIYVDIYGDYED